MLFYFHNLKNKKREKIILKKENTLNITIVSLIEQ